MVDEPEHRARDRRVASRTSTRRCSSRSPACTKAALEPARAHAVGGLRLPYVELDERELDGRSARCSSATGCSQAAARVSGTLRVLPLGGLGEIGKNMTVVEYDGRIVVVDIGLRFPTTDMLGIDLVLPDFSYLRDRADDIEAIVDHARPRGSPRRAAVGAARARRARPPVYGGRADGRDGALQARRAQAARRRARGRSTRASSSSSARSRSSSST